jgi:hypothetical protein
MPWCVVFPLQAEMAAEAEDSSPTAHAYVLHNHTGSHVSVWLDAAGEGGSGSQPLHTGKAGSVLASACSRPLGAWQGRFLHSNFDGRGTSSAAGQEHAQLGTRLWGTRCSIVLRVIATACSALPPAPLAQSVLALELRVCSTAAGPPTLTLSPGTSTPLPVEEADEEAAHPDCCAHAGFPSVRDGVAARPGLNHHSGGGGLREAGRGSSGKVSRRGGRRGCPPLLFFQLADQVAAVGPVRLDVRGTSTHPIHVKRAPQPPMLTKVMCEISGGGRSSYAVQLHSTVQVGAVDWGWLGLRVSGLGGALCVGGGQNT